jgi:glycosyltransferase involved in cell wall biosynthesis
MSSHPLDVPIRVLYVIDSLARGGAEGSLAAMAPHLVARGIDLKVAYLKEAPGYRDDLARSVDVISLAEARGARSRVETVLALTRLVRRVDPNLVHTTLFESDIAGRLAARIAGARVATSLVNETYGPEHFADPRIQKWKLRAAWMLDAGTSRLAVRMHAVSDRVADVMAHRLQYPRARIDVVPRGRDQKVLGAASDERRAAARRTLGIDADEVVILTVARHEYQKGLDVLIRAVPHILRSVPVGAVLVAGREGQESVHLGNVIAESGLGEVVRLLGDRRDVPDLLCAADVFVLPSRREGFPGSVVEAMALGVPIVATDLPTTREAVGEYATLVAVDSPEALASGLVRAYADRETTHAVAQGARERFRKLFSIDAIADKMASFFARAAGCTSEAASQ